MKSCKSCGKQNIEVVLDAGQQPISSRYLKTHNEKEELYNLKLHQCLSCGLVQLIDYVPVEKLQPIYKWVTYNEPEGHLDDVVNQLSQLEGINSESSILGISYKEDSTLARFSSLGFLKTERLAIPEKVSGKYEQVGIETVQNYISSKAFYDGGTDHHYDIILIRHILEHTHDSASFLQSLKKLTHKNSYLVFEVPDCSLLFSSCDYTALWEDHTLYFTPSTFKAFLKNAGFTIIKYHLYPYPYENCLVVIASVDDGVSDTHVSDNLDSSRELMLTYGNSFPNKKETVREQLQEIKKNYGDIAIFGAGHLATWYVNVMNIADLISFFVDDDLNKRDLLVPGCRLPIYSPSVLLDRDIKYCLTSLSPESEKKAMDENKEFLSRGGIFASIFPSNPTSFIKAEEVKAIIRKRYTCRLCYSNEINLIINMPSMPPVDNYRKMGEPEINIPNLPMDLYMCNACGHVQLLDVVDPDVLYGNYIYTTSSSPDSDDHFSIFVERTTDYLKLSGNEKILDIGSNDGLLLEKFKDLGHEVIGIDPSQLAAGIASKNGIETYVSYFNNESTKMLLEKHGKFELITANNVFSHADDLEEFAQCVENLLSNEGVFVFEVTYLLDLVQKRVLDDIYHEHLCHHSVSPLQIFMEKCNLKLINIDRLTVKGGSIRCYAVKATSAKKPEKIIDELIENEIQEGLYKLPTYEILSQEFQNLKLKVKSEIQKEQISGNTIAAYGASASSTVLSYLLDINPHLSYIVDDNEFRQERLSPGYMIPIKSSSSLLVDQPSIVIITAWRFAEKIIDNNQSYLDAGGTFIVPLPNFEVISNANRRTAI